MYSSRKKFDGFSTVFRQWKATTTHCSKLHGYAIFFDVEFGCEELDYREWCWDFGGMKRAKTLIDGMQPDKWMSYMFDHTTVISKDDPCLEDFKALEAKDALQLRIVDYVGCERFAEYVFKMLDAFVKEETNGRVHIVSVICGEHEKNSASYKK